MVTPQQELQPHPLKEEAPVAPPFILFLLPPPLLAASGKAEQSKISPYLQDVDVCIAEVDVEDFGERDTRTQHGCGGKKKSTTVSAAKRHGLPEATSIFKKMSHFFDASRLWSLQVLLPQHTPSPLPAR